MALHTCRDFRTIGNPLNLSMEWVAPYLQAIFLRTVLGFTIVGQTNFNIDSSPLRLGSGNNGSINFGGINTYAFAANGYTVSITDIGRILAVRSTNNPMLNSGLFRVTAVDTINNRLLIDYRSGDTPPVETGLSWALYADETVWYAALNFTGNGIVNTYTGQGSATQNRIILLSPHSSAWQVRIAIENGYDTGAGGVTPCAGLSTGGSTVAPGYGGNVAGDFAVGGEHTHTSQFFNNNTSDNHGRTVGLWPASSNQCRFYAWGDDVTGTYFAATRPVVSTTAGESFIHCGLCEDEELPLPPKNVQRLFVMGANTLINSGRNGIYWATGGGKSRGGMSFGLSNQPISAMYSLYCALFQSGGGGGFSPPSGATARETNYAGDNQYIGATELLPVDILVGTHDSQSSYYGQAEVMVLEGRRLGRAPFVRMGRSNYGYFQLSTDSQRSWIHLNDGMYLPWQGSILP